MELTEVLKPKEQYHITIFAPVAASTIIESVIRFVEVSFQVVL